jgi:membrane protease YdiL (CAAX protease family)
MQEPFYESSEDPVQDQFHHEASQDQSQFPPIFSQIPSLKEAVIIYLLSCVILIVFGSLLQELHLWGGLLITELVLVMGPPLLFTWRHQYSVKLTFSLTPIGMKTIGLSVLSAILAFVLVGGIAALQETILPRSQGYQEVWEQVLRQFHTIPFPLTFLLVAVLPGVCEELLFRGFLLRGFRSGLSDTAAIVWVGLLFGIFHFDLYRLLPVTLLGILFGYIVICTQSIFAGMAAHITNNGLAIGISYAAVRMQEQGYQIPTDSEAPSISQIVVGVLPIMVLALAGLWLTLRALRKQA